MQEMTAVIECWGSEGYRKTTPALFEETMKARYADATDDADMWNIIRNTACFDLGRLYAKQELGGYYIAEEISKVACGNNAGNWASRFDSIKTPMIASLKQIVEKYRALQD